MSQKLFEKSILFRKYSFRAMALLGNRDTGNEHTHIFLPHKLIIQCKKTITTQHTSGNRQKYRVHWNHTAQQLKVEGRPWLVATQKHIQKEITNPTRGIKQENIKPEDILRQQQIHILKSYFVFFHFSCTHTFPAQ